jgi:alpha-mannosidase
MVFAPEENQSMRSVALLFAMASVAAASATTQPAELTQPTVYLVGYAHLDTQWRWTYPQVIREFLLNTMRDNFPLLEKYPHYVFNFTGARRYELMKEYFPDDFERLRQYVKQGRWFPAGSSVDECDTDIPSAESLIRQVLYGNQFFRKEFGVVPHDFMLPDSFGFTAALPEILAHCGIKGFSTQKLTWGSAVGIPFKVGVWIGPDGRSVMAALDPGSYTSRVVGDVSHSQSFLDRINQTGLATGVYVDYHYYGIGDRGGAPAEASVNAAEKSLSGDGPVHVIAGRSDQMFDDITDAQRAKLPTYKGELLLTWHSTGSISSQAAMKRWNRKNELLADAAERASVAANFLSGLIYPSQRLHDAWFLVLGSQMHDMLAGTAMPPAYRYTWNDELLAANQFAAMTQDAAGAVSQTLDTTSRGVPLVVYNPLSSERSDVAEAKIIYNDPPAAVRVIGPEGEEVPSQIISADGSTMHILFMARVPSVGFAVYQVLPGASSVFSYQRASDSVLESPRFRVTLDSNGDIASIFDKHSHRDVLSGPARLAFLYEKPMQYPAWNMDYEDRQRPPREFVTGPATVRVIENGPVRAALEVTRESEGSKFVQQIRLTATDRIEVENQIDWQTPQSSLEATFPFVAANSLASYDSQVGVVQRGNNNPKKYEVPQHQWFDLTDASNQFGVAILNDCKYGSDKPDDHTMRLTLLYSPGVRDSYQDQATQDFGHHEILYAFAPHDGDWRQADIPSQAARLNQPLRAFQVVPHPGSGREFSLLHLNTSQAMVMAIKKAEESDEIIVRLRELNGQPVDVRVTAAAPIVAAREVTGQEELLGPAEVADGAMSVHLDPFALRAFALTLKDSQHPAVMQHPVDLTYDMDAVSYASRPADGDYSAGGTYPAEEFPPNLTVDGIDFHLGPTDDGQRNAVVCHGQTLYIPDGPFDRVYLLASAAGGDQNASFNETSLAIPNWASPIGEWDTRLWKGDIPEIAYDWHNVWDGLTPGYVKPAEVAWFSNHAHHAPEGNEYYHYCYLFKFSVPLPSHNARTLTLPDNPNVRLFAVTAAVGHDEARAAMPLFDTLETRTANAPTITPPGGKFNDLTDVSIQHPLYWRADALRYTLDGSDPTETSPVYAGPILLDRSATIKTALVDGGQTGPIATAHFDVHDITPPHIESASAIAGTPLVVVIFSRRVSPLFADDLQNYEFDPPLRLGSAALGEDGRTAVLMVKSPSDAADRLLGAENITGRAPPARVASELPVFVQSDPITEKLEANVEKLPVKADQPWTINFFCQPTQAATDHIVIAGFGHTDQDADGRGRYLADFEGRVHFWSHNQDVDTTAPLDIGQWQMLSATFDGKTLRVYKNGVEVGWGDVQLADDEAMVRAVVPDPWTYRYAFAGHVRGFSVWNQSLPPQALASFWQTDSSGR